MNQGLRRWSGPVLFTSFALLYAWTAGAFVHWLDSGELALAGATLGIPHPPGHPGYVVGAHGATFLPIGSLAFRTALFSALAAASAVVGVYALGVRLVGRLSRRETSDADVVTAVLMAAVFGLSAGLWLNAMRAEVYAMQACCAIWALERGLAWREHLDRPELLRWAALLAGLALTNHHYLMILALPSLFALVLMGENPRRAARRQILWVIGLGAMPSLAYFGLYIAANQTPWLNFGDPSSLERLWDVVTAKQFQQSVTSQGASVGENVFVAIELLIGQLRLPVVALSVLGWFALVRNDRVAGVVITVATVGNLLSKVVMDLDPQNPDAAGYLLVTNALVCVSATVGAVWVFQAIGAVGGRIATALAVAVTTLSVGLAVPTTLRTTSASGAVGTPTLDALFTRRMEPGAVALTSFYTFHFNRLYYSGVEGYRADIIALQRGLEGEVDGGRSLLRWARTHAVHLEPLLTSYTEQSKAGEVPLWPREALGALAASTPVYLEPSLDSPLHASFTDYASIYQRWRPAGQAANRDHRVLVDDLATVMETLGEELRRSREGRKATTLLFLQLAVERLRQVDGPGALATLSAVDLLSPSNPYTARLRPIAEPLAAAAAAKDRRRLRQLGNQAMRLDYARILFAGGER